MELEMLTDILKKSWNKSTSSDPDNWSEENPAWGQCAVSALILQDYLDAKLIRSKAILPNEVEISHYFNIYQGKEVDVTREQFPTGTNFEIREKPKEYNTLREYVLSYNPTSERYLFLKKIVNSFL